MSARILPLLRDVAWPLPSDFKTSLVCWGGYIVLLCCYCMLHQFVVAGVLPDVKGVIVHVCKNWGVWLLTTPVMFAACRKYAQRWVADGHARAVELVSFGMVVIFVSTAVPVAIDLLTNARDAASSLMIFLPRYIAVMGVVYLIWHAFLREHPRMEGVEKTASTTLQPIRAPEPEPPATLLVSKGADQCLIRISRIECASAAGNYVEIVERGQRYLMRATLKQVEDMLPTADFIRIHRSHLVRRDEIERIKSQPSGNGTVHLRGGQVLPLSKKHRQELQRSSLKSTDALRFRMPNGNASSMSHDDIPDVRDGLTRKERIVLYVLHQTQKERGDHNVPTPMLWGRVCEYFYISPQELSAMLARLGARK